MSGLEKQRDETACGEARPPVGIRGVFLLTVVTLVLAVAVFVMMYVLPGIVV